MPDTIGKRHTLDTHRSAHTGSELARQQKRSFALITGSFVVLLLISIAASWAAIEMVNSTRAYSTGEGRYSKAQKIAVISLHRYADSRRAEDYEAFLSAIKVPRGDHAARLAMQATPVDTDAAREGFLRGENHPDDIDGMILLFRLSYWWGPFAAAVADWTNGDALVEQLATLGVELHRHVVEGSLDPNKRTELLAAIDQADDRLTVLENEFSTHQGEAARTATQLVVLGVGSMTILLWGSGMIFARRLLRIQLALAEREAAELESANTLLLASSLELEAAREKAEQERARAERASSAKSDFLSNMSHELRTPLNSILGFAQLLELNTKDPLSLRQKRQVTQIHKSGGHLLSLIEDILDLSKIEAGNVKLSVEPVLLRPMLEQVHAALSPLADKAAITIVMEVSEDAPVARADRTRLLQILMNLANNALKYNRPGGTLALTARTASENTVRISVTDTGQGIPTERQTEVFQAFNRLGAEQSAIEGTGIGLSITRNLVLLMGGRISFESTPNVGTVFTVDLPAESHAPEADSKATASNVLDLNQLRRNYTLLYIEDNPSNIELMSSLIDTLDGIKLLTAAHPTIGLSLAEAHLPDIIVVDIDLPEIDGFEVRRRLEATPATRNIPVIAISAAAMPRDIERGLSAGFTHYLTKPLNIREFFSAVDSNLNETARDRHRI